MARREIRTSRVFNIAMEDIRRKVKNEKKEVEERLRATPKKVVLQEEFHSSDRQQLLEEMKNLREKLCLTERDNSRLKADLQRAKDQIGWRDREITSLNRDLSALEKKYNATVVTCRNLNREHVKAEETIKRREEEILSLQRETERMRESVGRLKDSSRFETMEDKWQREISQLKELLKEKEEQISRAVHKRQTRTKAHLDTLALLTDTQSALEQSKLTCQALEEQRLKQLAEKEESHQKELKEREESVRRQLSETVNTSRHKLSKLSESWESRAQQWAKEKRELQEMMLVKEKIWKYEEADIKGDIEHLTKENVRLQKLIMEKNETWSFWSW